MIISVVNHTTINFCIVLAKKAIIRDLYDFLRETSDLVVSETSVLNSDSSCCSRGIK